MLTRWRGAAARGCANCLPMIAVRLFRLTKGEYFADFFITPPITIFALTLSLLYGFSAWWPLLFVGGWLLWTLYEYLIHRFVTHKVWGFRYIHNLHHAHQKDFIGTHPVLTLAQYALFWWCFGVGNGSAVMVGFSVGYITYSTLHTLFHYTHIRHGTLLYQAKVRHAIHHVNGAKNFGVTIPLWDHVFGTFR